MTEEQSKFLATLPNASKFIREIIDEMMAGHFGELTRVLIELKTLDAEMKRLRNERREAYNSVNLYAVTEEVERIDRDDNGKEVKSTFTKVLKDADHYPIPKDSEEARNAVNLIRAYDNEIKAIEKRIEELNAKIAILGTPNR